MTWLRRRLGVLSSLIVGPLLQRSDPQSGVHALRVRNAGSHVVRSLFVAPTGSGAWGRDRLARPLRPGARTEIVLFGVRSAFDVRVVYDGGRAEVFEAVEAGPGEVVLRY